VHPEAVGAFRATLASEYRKYNGLTPEIHVCLASEGASEIFL
jgi:hypothetical protein